MTLISYTKRPTGQDPMFISDLLDNYQLVTGAVNGSLKDENLAPSAAIVDSKMASPNNATWKNLICAGCHLTSANGSGDKMFTQFGSPQATGGEVQTLGGLDLYTFVPGDLALPGKLTKFRIVLFVATNATASTRTFIGKLFSAGASGSGGGSGALNFDAVQFGNSTAALVAPAASTLAGPVVSADFDVPVATSHLYLGVNISAAIVANSVMALCMRLDYKHV